MNADDFTLGAGGCRCASCRETARFWNAGFAKWPRGTPAGNKANRDYSAHCAYAWRDAIKRSEVNTNPLAFYGQPIGITRAQQLATMRRQFSVMLPDSAFTQLGEAA